MTPTDSPPGFTVAADPTQIFSRGAWFEKQDFGVSLWFAAWPEGMTVTDESGTEYTVTRYRQGTRGKQHQRLENHNHWLIVTKLTGTLHSVPVGTTVRVASKREQKRGIRVVFV